MKTHDSFESDETLEEQASAWLIECAEGFSPERAAAFAEWSRRDQRHAAAIARVEKSLALLDAMPAVRAPVEASFTEKKRAPQVRHPFGRAAGVGTWPWAVSLAAALMLGIVLWPLISNRGRPVENYAADATAARRLALSDGSVVDLNSNSRLQVQFLPAKRQLNLTEGEAHFQVAHDSAHPFVVNVRGISVRAVGTAFNIKLDGDRVEVTVTEGRVTVERQHAAENAPALLPLLAAGEQMQVNAGSEAAPCVGKISPDAVHALLSWQDRMTSFVDVPLREMVARINRCNATQLVLGDAELGERKIGGVIALNQVDAFVHLLEQDGDIVAENRSGTEIVLRRVH